jgi:DNA-binding transcriptional regulator YiaG
MDHSTSNPARLLRDAGWTIGRIAEHCGVSYRTVENWLQGRKPSGPAAKLLAEAVASLG